MTTPIRLADPSLARLAEFAFSPEERLQFPLDAAHRARIVHAALEEDAADADVTTNATIEPDRSARASLVARRAGVICGTPLAIEAFRQRDPSVSIREDSHDARTTDRGDTILLLSGNARGMLGAERVALNFMQRLSGIATLTAQYVHAVRGTHARILDTRKTTPGWRRLERYAVRCGGGMSHRNDLEQAILIKDNHIAALGNDVALAVKRGRAAALPGTRVEVECDDLDQVEVAVSAGADIIMLDNMGLHDMRDAVKLVAGRAVIEASGGVNLQTVRGIAETGVNWISVGSLTHSAPALDLALDFDE
ncbi:MAG: carboxylating nicotinate-nucleotide diphosphorylase [Gemmatimonadota bacterium]|nr:carboxylating nicotinate-nucleotide diphosphorylase [Gemmatimonadota bacterium]